MVSSEATPKPHHKQSPVELEGILCDVRLPSSSHGLYFHGLARRKHLINQKEKDSIHILSGSSVGCRWCNDWRRTGTNYAVVECACLLNKPILTGYSRVGTFEWQVQVVLVKDLLISFLKETFWLILSERLHEVELQVMPPSCQT